ncbi:MAG: ATPase [Pseudomonadota bacterium]
MSHKNPIIRAVDGEASEPDTVEPSAPDGAADHASEDAELLLEEYDEVAAEEAPTGDRVRTIATVLAVVVGLGWTGFYAWANRGALAQAGGAAPSEWARWIIDWSVPLVLICVAWILAMRNSTREANRFASSAALLSRESAELENRLSVVNRELSLAREFLASQSRDLETLGRIAAERLSTNAAELQDLIVNNGKQVENIGTASDTALANMTRLRDDLPVIANSARDVNNQVGSTGRTAREQLDKLVEGFERLNTFGTASENQVTALTSRIGKTIQDFEGNLTRVEETLEARFAGIQTQAEEYRGAITDTETQALNAMTERVSLLQTETNAISEKMRAAEAEALEQVLASKARWEQEIVTMAETLDELDRQAVEASQTRVKELNEEAGRFDDRLEQRDLRFFEEMKRRQSDFDTREAQSTEVLSQRLSALDEAIAERREAQIAETKKLTEQSDEMVAQIEKLSVMITRVKDLGTDARTGLTEGMDALGESLESKRASLIETDANLTALTDASVRLLEIIQSGAKHSREDLPEAIETAANQLGAVEERAAQVSGAMFAMGQKSEDLSSYLIKTTDTLSDADATLETLHAKVVERSDDAMAKLNGLRGGLERLSQDSETFAGDTQEALIASIGKLEEATKATIDTLDEGARTKVIGLAEQLSREAVTALEKALRTDSAETIGALEQAAAHASGVGREATVQLRDQLARVNELTNNLEQRIGRARDLAEEQIDNDFARRMALITDSLNSSAIDISNAMSTEVSDAAWDSYLKGDRGIFTRRAVRLLDSTDARAIADLYQHDDTFKANVNRYIHDFERMLRSMLSTRDGNALSVTILGSDMGKLYVALAQAIERLRK